MLKYIKYIPGLIYMSLFKVFHFKQVKFSFYSYIHPSLRIELKNKNATVNIGRSFCCRENVVMRVSGELIIEENVFINAQCRLECKQSIKIGANTLLGPNVMMFDHDHKYNGHELIRENGLITGNIIVGQNVWIGANTTILRSTNIGDNSVIGANSLIKGNIPASSIAYQKRETVLKKIVKK